MTDDLYHSPLGEYCKALYPEIAFYDEGFGNIGATNMWTLQLSEQYVVTITDHDYIDPVTREQDTWENTDAIETVRVINLLVTRLIDGVMTHTLLSDITYEGANLCFARYENVAGHEGRSHAAKSVTINGLTR